MLFSLLFAKFTGAYREFAERENIKIVDTYIDRAMIGTNDHRPDFQRMLHDSKKKGFDFVLVYKFDRFARSRHDSAVNKAILSRNGVKVISATEQISDTPEGIILEGMLESFAEYYSAELSQKVKRGRKESRIKGLFVGGRKPFGYCIEDKIVKINEKQAEIVRQVYNDYISGMRLKDIASKLNKQGIKTNNGKDFNINQVSRMLRSSLYCGKVYADDESKNIKLENAEDYTEIGKEQSGSDCSHLVRLTGLEPARFPTGT